MLSPIQVIVVRTLANHLENSDFALVGGAALISLGLINRRTDDLDFFGSEISVLSERIPAIERDLRSQGFDVSYKHRSPQFVRFEVSRESEATEVDFALDARLFPTQMGALSPTLSSIKLGVDKVLAVFGRAEARDFSDLATLSKVHGFEQLIALAPKKDPGFSLKIFEQMSHRFEQLDRRSFPVDDEEYEEITSSVASWRAYCRENERHLHRNQAPSRGHGS